MPTIEELAKASAVVKFGGGLLRYEIPERAIYGTSEVITWIKGNINGLETDGYIHGAATPKQQLASLLRAYVRGDSYEDFMLPKIMSPNSAWVWELRTHDLRLFGWFYRRGCFIVTDIDTKANCTDNALYNGYRDQCVAWRDACELTPPLVTEGYHEDVF